MLPHLLAELARALEHQRGHLFAVYSGDRSLRKGVEELVDADPAGMRTGRQSDMRASDEKWQRYELALLQIMGFAQFPTSETAMSYQLLIIPTFRAPCCLRITLADQDGELSFGLLVDRYWDVFDAIWRADPASSELAGRFAKRTCLEDIAYLNAAQAAALRQHLAAIEPTTLQDIDLAARDGVSMRCDCRGPTTYHTFTMRSPTAKQAPDHVALCQLFLDTAREHFPHPQLGEYLAVLASSF